MQRECVSRAEKSAVTAAIAGNIQPLELRKPSVLLAFRNGTGFADPSPWEVKGRAMRHRWSFGHAARP
jgi:hypothetical protein